MEYLDDNIEKSYKHTVKSRNGSEKVTGAKKKTTRKKHTQLNKAEIRRKRRRERRRIVLMQRIAVAVLAVAVIGGGGFAIVWNLPVMKLNRQLDAGAEYTEEAAYNEAIEAYENALEIDSTSVKAYRCMAGAYLDMEDSSHAKQKNMVLSNPYFFAAVPSLPHPNNA